jgi:hypothetical protein
MNKHAPRGAAVVLGLILLITSFLGLMGMKDPVYVVTGIQTNTLLGSNLHFFNGM